MGLNYLRKSQIIICDLLDESLGGYITGVLFAHLASHFYTILWSGLISDVLLVFAPLLAQCFLILSYPCCWGFESTYGSMRCFLLSVFEPYYGSIRYFLVSVFALCNFFSHYCHYHHLCCFFILSFDPKPKMYSFCSLWINLCLDIVCSLLKTVGWVLFPFLFFMFH